MIDIINKRQSLDDPTFFEFLTSELSVPCLTYNATFVRTFNALPADIELDVYLNGILLSKNLEYKRFSYYIPVLGFQVYSVKVFVSGKSDNPIIDTNIELVQENVETLAIVGTLENPGILTVVGELGQEILTEKSIIRYANLTPDNITINVFHDHPIDLQGANLKPGEYTRYEATGPGLYRFEFSLSDNPQSPKTSISHILKDSRIYTFYLVGSMDVTSIIHSSYPLELVISVDVVTIIKKCPIDMKRKDSFL